MLGESLLRNEHNALDSRGAGSGFRVAGKRLCIEASSRAAEKPGKSGGQCEVAYGIGPHREFLSTVGLGSRPRFWRLSCWTGRTKPNSGKGVPTRRLFESWRRDWLQT